MTPITAITVEPGTANLPPLDLAAADAAGWQSLRFTMPAEGADSDGYVTVTFLVG